MTGTGLLTLQAIAPGGKHHRLAWGPAAHLSSNWDKAGRRVGRGLCVYRTGLLGSARHPRPSHRRRVDQRHRTVNLEAWRSRPVAPSVSRGRPARHPSESPVARPEILVAPLTAASSASCATRSASSSIPTAGLRRRCLLPGPPALAARRGHQRRHRCRGRSGDQRSGRPGSASVAAHCADHGRGGITGAAAVLPSSPPAGQPRPKSSTPRFETDGPGPVTCARSGPSRGGRAGLLPARRPARTRPARRTR